MSSAKPARLEVDVVTYNVLSPLLCDTRSYPKCTADAVDPAKRQQRVWDKLVRHVASRRVICLQELARDWYADLLPLLNANRYVIVWAQCGHDGNGHMGDAVAYPTDKFDLVRVALPRVAAVANWPLPPPPPVPLPPGAPHNAVDLAISRQNVMVMLRLRCVATGTEVVVATYHMPCMYDRPEVMQLHSAAAVSQAQAFADGDPLVLAGDFNFRPHSPEYLIATRTRAQRTDERATLAAHPYLHKRHLRTHAKMRSAYLLAHGAEPAFTHHSHTVWKSGKVNPFVGTLDYIFVSEHFTHVAATLLPASTAEYGESLPTEDEPSDHLEVRARMWARVSE